MGNKENFTLDPENRLPFARYQFVNVTFETADEDMAIKHRLNPVNAEEVMYIVTRLTSGADIYQDVSPTRKPWQRSHIFLRASAPTAATLLLCISANDEELLREGPEIVTNVTTPTTTVTDRERSFGITIDAGSSVITTGIKGFIRVPIAGYITRATLMSTDAAVTSGSIVIDIWKDSYSNWNPTAADTIIGGATPTPPTLSSATASEDTILSGWTRTFAAGSIFGFSVTSVTSLKRVTLVIDYLPT